MIFFSALPLARVFKTMTKAEKAYRMFLWIVVICISIVPSLGDIECGDQLFTEKDGKISSPVIPSDDLSSIIECTFDIKLSSKSRWLKITWQLFDLVGTMPKCDEADYIDVYSG